METNEMLAFLEPHSQRKMILYKSHGQWKMILL